MSDSEVEQLSGERLDRTCDYAQFTEALLVEGRYRVRACLSNGTSGAVFLCVEPDRPHRLLAIKLLLKGPATSQDQLERFRNEMVLSTCVEHPNVAYALDTFESEQVLGFSTEFAAGGDLGDYLAHHGRVPLPRALRLIEQAGRGLQAIHRAGLVHRDLKPENILIFHEESFKIADFGVATMVPGLSAVVSDQILGTFDYIPPEVIERGEISIRSDIYALGVLAYEIITGICPFQGLGMLESLRSQLSCDPAAPSRLNYECTPALDRVLLRALARDPGQRYQYVAEFLEELQSVLKLKSFGRLIRHEEEGNVKPLHAWESELQLAPNVGARLPKA